jgi:hypothetical protein
MQFNPYESLFLNYLLLLLFALGIVIKTRSQQTPITKALFGGFSLFASANLFGIVALVLSGYPYTHFELAQALFFIVDVLTSAGYATVAYQLSSKSKSDFRKNAGIVVISGLLALWGFFTYTIEGSHNYGAFTTLVWAVAAISALLALTRAAAPRLVIAGFAAYLVSAVIDTGFANEPVTLLANFGSAVGSLLVFIGILKWQGTTRKRTKK